MVAGSRLRSRFAPDRRASTLLVVMVIVAACSSPGPTPQTSAGAAAPSSATSTAPPMPSPAVPPSTAATASGRPASLKWVRGGAYEAARLDVPRDYADPTAGSVGLIVGRRQATDPAHRIGTLFLGPGGPGMSGLGLLGSPANVILPPDVLERFDLVSWEPRGVDLSTGLACPDEATAEQVVILDPDLVTQAGFDAYAAAYARVGSACAASPNAALLPFLAEANSARDMDRIRAALGEETISYWGWSYGSYLGYLYATMFPQRVRAAILDGPIDPTLDRVGRDLSQARGYDAALEHLLDMCAASTACPFHGGADPAAALDALLARIRRSPLPAGEGATLNVGQALLGIEGWLYRSDPTGLAASLASAERGDGTGLLAASGGPVPTSLGEYFGPLCLDVPGPSTASDVEAAYRSIHAASPRFGGSVAVVDLYGCVTWPAKEVATPPPAARGLPPILVLAATWDAATPPWEAAPLASALGTGVVVMRDGWGHTSGDAMAGSTCLQDVTTVYLVELRAPAPHTVCNDPPLSFGP